MTSYFNQPHLHDEQAAIDYVEARVWGPNRVCPHCGGLERHGKLGGKSTRLGVWKCYDCRKPFTVKIGTIFEDSPIKMHLWLQAIFLMASSKKGVSANQLGRILGVTLKTSWFMGHRIRLAMSTQPTPFMGSGGKVVEADETYFGNKYAGTGRKRWQRAGHGHKHTVFALVERGGKVRSTHIAGEKLSKGIVRAMDASVSDDANVMTDDGRWYRNLMGRFESHETVNHSKGEYVRGSVHTNTIEGVFSVFKRGMTGIYQHCQEQHLHRYLSEFDFRYNNRAALKINDQMRMENMVKGVSGKRLTYKTTN